MRENPDETRLTFSSFSVPLWFASRCWWPLFSLFPRALYISFSRCSSLNIRPSTNTFSCSLSRSSRRFLLILAFFLTFLRVFLDSFDAFYLLLSLAVLSLSFQPIFTQNPFSTDLNYNDFLRLIKLQLCRYCCFSSRLKITKYWELLFNYNLPNLISRSKRVLQIICTRSLTSTSPREPCVMPNCVPAVRCTKAWYSSMRTSLWSADVSLHTVMGCPSYARNRACALPSPSPFHYVMAKIVPAMQLAAHAKSSTLYGRSYGVKSKFFRLDGLLLFCIIMGLWCARCEFRYSNLQNDIIY